MRYGVPYIGSKNAIARRIVDALPGGGTFYDIFCGGCSVTHAAILSGKYGKVVANDTDWMPQRLFADAVSGKYACEKEWISREEFKRRRETDPYVAICWSFGNNMKDYMYSKEYEPWKHALHNARVNGDFGMMLGFGIRTDGSRGDIVRNKDEYRRIYTEWYCSNYGMQSLQRLQSLERLESLQRLQSLQSLQRMESLQSMEMTCKDYADVSIEPGSVVYCDIPYKGTKEYMSGGFDHDRFYDWCIGRDFDIFVSEYSMPDGMFDCVMEIDHRSMYGKEKNGRRTERLFVPKGQRRRACVHTELLFM